MYLYGIYTAAEIIKIYNLQENKKLKKHFTNLNKIKMGNLDKIDHIVVVMMENRSFDHMLGYHSIDAGGMNGIDGLKDTFRNYYKEKVFRPIHLGITAFPNKIDPPHDYISAEEQVANNNSGFAKTFIEKTRPPEALEWIFMGYYDSGDIPLFDYLSRNYCVCNKWFGSVLGETWPNRLYAVTGRADGSRNNNTVPLYNLPSFVRHLDDRNVSWSWYYHDAPTISLTDGNYKAFPFFSEIKKFNDYFEEDINNNKLASVSWIDPNFTDLGGAATANDDHPPADINHGQLLLSGIYNTIRNSSYYEKTMLVIVYDEHGGFYDHVNPPQAPDNDADFRRYGVRVPAIVISPFTGKGTPSDTLFDHTSIIKTILKKFCSDASGNIPDMGLRTQNANDLGVLLTESKPLVSRNYADFLNIKEKLDAWSENFAVMPYTENTKPQLNDLQKGIIRAMVELEKEGIKSDIF